MSETKIGRPTMYTEDLADVICGKVSDRDNLYNICKEPGMPSRDTVYRWLRELDSFADKYERARETRADSRADYIDEICQKVINGKLSAPEARVIIEAQKWQAGHERGNRYGERFRHDIGGQKDNPVQSEAKVVHTMPQLDTKNMTDEQLRAVAAIRVTVKEHKNHDDDIDDDGEA